MRQADAHHSLIAEEQHATVRRAIDGAVATDEEQRRGSATVAPAEHEGSSGAVLRGATAPRAKQMGRDRGTERLPSDLSGALSGAIARHRC